MESRIHREVYVRFGREYGTVEIDDRLCLPHDLDIKVSKLKLLKANHTSNQYRLEDNIAKIYPKQIASLTEQVNAYKADIQHYEANKITDPEQFQMEIAGKTFTDKKEAGTALLAACKTLCFSDMSMDVGKYQGFQLRIKFEPLTKEYVLQAKHQAVESVFLGSDPLGNITRINNMFEGYQMKLQQAEQRLQMIQTQLEDAKEAVGKPFPKEEELQTSLERLNELNALLNMDEKGDTAFLEEDQQEETAETREDKKQSIHERMIQAREKMAYQPDKTEHYRNAEVCVG